MRRSAIPALVFLGALLTGCISMSVDELQANAVKRAAPSVQTPERAAACVARRLESNWQGLVALVRAAEQPGAWEVVMRTPDIIGGYVAYALATPNAGGAAMTVWITANRIGGEDVAQDVLKGC